MLEKNTCVNLVMTDGEAILQLIYQGKLISSGEKKSGDQTLELFGKSSLNC